VLDIFGEFFGFGLNKALMRGEAANSEAAAKGVPLKFAQVGAVGCCQRFPFRQVHPTVQNVHGLDANRAGLVHHLLYGDLRVPELQYEYVAMPEAIRLRPLPDFDSGMAALAAA
jgi:hypothetical protein